VAGYLYAGAGVENDAGGTGELVDGEVFPADGAQQRRRRARRRLARREVPADDPPASRRPAAQPPQPAVARPRVPVEPEDAQSGRQVALDVAGQVRQSVPGDVDVAEARSGGEQVPVEPREPAAGQAQPLEADERPQRRGVDRYDRVGGEAERPHGGEMAEEAVGADGRESIAGQIDDLQVAEAAERAARYQNDAIARQMKLLERRVDGESVVANGRDAVVGQSHDLDVRVKVNGDRGEAEPLAVGRFEAEDGDDLAWRRRTMSSHCQQHEEDSDNGDQHRSERAEVKATRSQSAATRILNR